MKNVVRSGTEDHHPYVFWHILSSSVDVRAQPSTSCRVERGDPSSSFSFSPTPRRESADNLSRLNSELGTGDDVRRAVHFGLAVPQRELQQNDRARHVTPQNFVPTYIKHRQKTTRFFKKQTERQKYVDDNVVPYISSPPSYKKQNN